MCEHGGSGAARDEFLEMAGLSMALHGRAGLGAGVHHLPRRAVAGVELKVTLKIGRTGALLRSLLDMLHSVSATEYFPLTLDPLPPPFAARQSASPARRRQGEGTPGF